MFAVHWLSEWFFVAGGYRQRVVSMDTWTRIDQCCQFVEFCPGHCVSQVRSSGIEPCSRVRRGVPAIRFGGGAEVYREPQTAEHCSSSRLEMLLVTID